MGILDPKNYDTEEHAENAEGQANIVLHNCLHMLGLSKEYFQNIQRNPADLEYYLRKRRSRYNIPDFMAIHFTSVLVKVLATKKLLTMNFLCKKIIVTHLLVEEQHDFNQYEGDTLKALEGIISYEMNEENKNLISQMMKDLNMSISTGGAEPPSEDMVHAEDYFADELMFLLKLEAGKENTRIPIFIDYEMRNVDLSVIDGKLAIKQGIGMSGDVHNDKRKQNETSEVESLIQEGKEYNLINKRWIQRWLKKIESQD